MVPYMVLYTVVFQITGGPNVAVVSPYIILLAAKDGSHDREPSKVGAHIHEEAAASIRPAAP